MFTGLIRELGTVGSLGRRSEGALLEVRGRAVPQDAAVGDSIAVEGVCLTAERADPEGFAAFVSAETLARTTLGSLRRGDRVNLEPSLRLSDKVGGHLVQGHVEGLGEVLALRKTGEGAILTVSVPTDLVSCIAPKGSLALSGVSLTVAALSANRVEVALVPLTLEATTLGGLRPGDRVNVETDLVARHVVAYLKSRGTRREWTVKDLEEMGF